MKSKAQEALDLALEAAASATRLDKAYTLNRIAEVCFAKLEQADLYMPGFSAEHRTEVLARLRDNVLNGTERAVELCTDDRKDLNRLQQSIIDDLKKKADAAKKAIAEAKKAKKRLPPEPLLTLATPHPAIRLYNQKASEYLARRQAAEDALNNLTMFAETFDVPDLCEKQESEIKNLLKQLDELQYHQRGSQRIELLKIRD